MGQDVKAEDYATPEKYLDGAEIPTFYQFQSNLVADEDLKPGMVRNLEVDKRLTLPTRTHIRFLVTGQDVLHCFSVPALGLKTDATPGRINRINTFIQREGVFYGSAPSSVERCTASCPSSSRPSPRRPTRPMRGSGTRSEASHRVLGFSIRGAN